MVKDRFNELQEIRKKAHLPLGAYTEDENTTVYMSESPAEAQLLELLDRIGPLYKRIKELNVEVIELHKELHDKSKRKEFAHKIVDVKTEARSLFKSIQETSFSINSEWHLVSYVAKTHQLALITIFSSANTELSNLQVDLHKEHKRYIKKELRITGQEVTDIELENLLDNPSEIFTQNLIQDTLQAKQSLLDIQERHDEILKIEKSIIEVNQLFQELAILVKDQGEKIDRIETYVHEAKDRAEQAHTELKQAKVNQTKARKKKYIIFGIIAAVLLVIILIIVLSV